MHDQREISTDHLYELTRAVDAVSTLLLGAEADGGAEADNRWLVLLLAGLGNRVVDGLEVAVQHLAKEPQNTRATYESPLST